LKIQDFWDLTLSQFVRGSWLLNERTVFNYKGQQVPEDCDIMTLKGEGITLSLDFEIHNPNDTAPHPRRPEPSDTAVWECHTWPPCIVYYA
jgi:hypothetical protein